MHVLLLRLVGRRVIGVQRKVVGRRAVGRGPHRVERSLETGKVVLAVAHHYGTVHEPFVVDPQHAHFAFVELRNLFVEAVARIDLVGDVLCREVGRNRPAVSTQVRRIDLSAVDGHADHAFDGIHLQRIGRGDIPRQARHEILRLHRIEGVFARNEQRRYFALFLGAAADTRVGGSHRAAVAFD